MHESVGSKQDYTLVVHALNDVNWLLDGLLFSNEANA